MRRSRSFSNIPLPTSRRNLSNDNLSVRSSQQDVRTSQLGVRTSQQGVRTSQQGLRTSQQDLRRSVSSNNLFLATRSAVTVDSRENNDILGSTNKNASRRITATPLRSIGSSSVCRRINATPLSHCKVAASPAPLLTTNLINDKKFSSDQLRKISTFLEEKWEVFDPKSLKPLSLGSFVQIISVLFKEIDPRIKINMQNYKEVVFKYLKLYKYPGPVTMSLLKSVNTNISWTQVMSIFGWLVDLIGEMTSLPNEYLLRKYILHNAKECQSGNENKELYIEYIEEYLNFDKSEADTLENEFEILRQEAEIKRNFINEQKKLKVSLLENLERMKSEIKEFKENNIEAEIENETRILQSENKMLAKEIDDLKQSIYEIQQTISNQKYSLADKQELLKKFEDKKYSVSLRKEELQNLLTLKDDFDYKQTNFRRQIEKEIHEINGRLVELNLSNFIDARIIRLPDSGMGQPKFAEEIEQKKQLLIDIAKKIDFKFEESKKTLAMKEKEFGQLCDEVEKFKSSNDTLKQKIEKSTVDINRVMFECDEYRKQQEKKNKNMTKIVTDIEAVKEERNKIVKELLFLKGENDKLNKFVLKVSKDFYTQALNNITQMQEIKVNLAEKSLKAYEKMVCKKREFVRMLYENINN